MLEDVTSLTETITNLSSGTKYSIKVILKYGKISSIASNEVTIYTSSKILKYTNAKDYFQEGISDDEIIKNIKKLFDKSNYDSSNFFNIAVYFYSECTEEVYFQEKKLEPITASKVTISSCTPSRGVEPIKGFYITASNTEDFSNQVELYRGEHNANNPNTNIVTTEYEFTPKGSYQYYRLYVTSWWNNNRNDGQHIRACYIE